MKNQEFEISIAQLNAATMTPFEVPLSLDITRTNNNGVTWVEYWYPKQIWIRNNTGVNLKWNTLSTHEYEDYAANPGYYDLIPVDNFAEAENKPSGHIEKLLILNDSGLPAIDPLYVYGINYYLHGQT